MELICFIKPVVFHNSNYVNTSERHLGRRQILFFNHCSLDLTLSEPTIYLDKQLWAASSSVVIVQSLTNSGKSFRIVWKICPWQVPQVIRLFSRDCASRESLITLWTYLGQISSDNLFGLSTACTRVSE